MYYNRLVEKEIELNLRTSGAVVVAGPKFCGKTTTYMLYQKMVLTAIGGAYQRENGVYVAPINLLRP